MTRSYMWRQGPESSLPALANLPSQLYLATDTGHWFVADESLEWQRTNIIPRGSWGSGTTYYKNDLVLSGGSQWRALRTNVAVTPAENADWTLFVAKGDAGAAGPSVNIERGDSTIVTAVATVDFSTAFNVSASPATEANVSPNFGSAAGTISEGDHTHASAAPFTDTTAIVKGSTDATKLVRIEADGLTTGITRVITMPDKDVDLGNLPPVTDTTAIVKGSADPTKLVRVEADGLATATTRVITMPNKDVDLGGLPPVADTTAIVKGSTDATKLVRVEADGLTTATTRVITMPDRDIDLGALASTTHATTHNPGGSDVIQRFERLIFTFRGTLPITNGTTTGTLRVPIPAGITGTLVSVTGTINGLPVGAGSSQTLDIRRSGTSVYSSAAKVSFTPGGSQFISGAVPDTTALTGGTHYLTVDLITAGSPSSGGSDLVLTMRYRY